MSDDVYEKLCDAIEINAEVVDVANVAHLGHLVHGRFHQLLRPRRMPVERPRGVGRTSWFARNMESD